LVEVKKELSDISISYSLASGAARCLSKLTSASSSASISHRNIGSQQPMRAR